MFTMKGELYRCSGHQLATIFNLIRIKEPHVNNAVLIQARMGSSRLPGKALKMLGKKQILEHVVERCKSSQAARVIVATTVSALDDPICAWCREHNVVVSRGSEENVQDRLINVARFHRVDLICRVCADCPFIDPRRIDDLLREYEPGMDYVGFRVGSRPGVLTHAGLPELVTTICLERLRDFSRASCEHVTWGCHQRVEVAGHWLDGTDYHGDNTLDTESDLEIMRDRYNGTC